MTPTKEELQEMLNSINNTITKLEERRKQLSGSNPSSTTGETSEPGDTFGLDDEEEIAGLTGNESNVIRGNERSVIRGLDSIYTSMSSGNYYAASPDVQANLEALRNVTQVLNENLVNARNNPNESYSEAFEKNLRETGRLIKAQRNLINAQTNQIKAASKDEQRNNQLQTQLLKTQIKQLKVQIEQLKKNLKAANESAGNNSNTRGILDVLKTDMSEFFPSIFKTPEEVAATKRAKEAERAAKAQAEEKEKATKAQAKEEEKAAKAQAKEAEQQQEQLQKQQQQQQIEADKRSAEMFELNTAYPKKVLYDFINTILNHDKSTGSPYTAQTIQPYADKLKNDLRNATPNSNATTRITQIKQNPNKAFDETWNLIKTEVISTTRNIPDTDIGNAMFTAAKRKVSDYINIAQQDPEKYRKQYLQQMKIDEVNDQTKMFMHYADEVVGPIKAEFIKTFENLSKQIDDGNGKIRYNTDDEFNNYLDDCKNAISSIVVNSEILEIVDDIFQEAGAMGQFLSNIGDKIGNSRVAKAVSDKAKSTILKTNTGGAYTQQVKDAADTAWRNDIMQNIINTDKNNLPTTKNDIVARVKSEVIKWCDEHKNKRGEFLRSINAMKLDEINGLTPQQQQLSPNQQKYNNIKQQITTHITGIKNQIMNTIKNSVIPNDLINKLNELKNKLTTNGPLNSIKQDYETIEIIDDIYQEGLFDGIKGLFGGKKSDEPDWYSPEYNDYSNNTVFSEPTSTLTRSSKKPSVIDRLKNGIDEYKEKAALKKDLKALKNYQPETMESRINRMFDNIDIDKLTNDFYDKNITDEKTIYESINKSEIESILDDIIKTIQTQSEDQDIAEDKIMYDKLLKELEEKYEVLKRLVEIGRKKRKSAIIEPEYSKFNIDDSKLGTEAAQLVDGGDFQGACQKLKELSQLYDNTISKIRYILNKTL